MRFGTSLLLASVVERTISGEAELDPLSLKRARSTKARAARRDPKLPKKEVL